MRKKGEGKKAEEEGGGLISLQPPACCLPDLTAVLSVCQIRQKPELQSLSNTDQAILKIKSKILMKAVYSGNRVTGSLTIFNNSLYLLLTKCDFQDITLLTTKIKIISLSSVKRHC